MQGCNVLSIFLFYIFDALGPGVVGKEHSDSVGTRFQLLCNTDILPPINGLPVQALPGLDTTRQTCLFEKLQGVLQRRGHGNHILHLSQVQYRNRLFEYRFHCGADSPVHHWW